MPDLYSAAQYLLFVIIITIFVKPCIPRLVLREGFELVVIGLIFGIAGAASLQKVMATEIYGVRPLDPLVFASVMALLAIVTLAACVIPARRAMHVEPTVALRYE